jgi:phospholipase C
MIRRAALCLVPLLMTGCDPQKSSFGFEAITTMKTPVDDPALACGVTLPADTKQSAREACAFQSGASPESTLGVDRATAAKLPIKHVIVMMKENRSFDHLLGKLHDRGQPGTDAVPADYVNLDLQGQPVAPFHATTTCITTDPGHQSDSMRTSVNGGKMDGFVKNAAQTTDTDGHFVMAYNDETELPFDYFLAKTWALDDRHFAPVVSGTFANRNFYMFGTNAGAVDTGIVFPSPDAPSIFQLLISAGYTWGVYTDNFPLSGSVDWTAKDPGVHPLADLFTALDQGTLPNVVFVDGTDSIDDDHPVADLQKGEAWSKRLYDHVVTSPQWNRTALIWTYDEGGGFADHVDPGPACLATPGSKFDHRGPRVPFVVISPWAKRNYVSHVVEDHTAITRFIELLFGLPALTARDANSPALLDLFDFSCGRDLSFPAAPDAGTGGCANPP